MWRRCVAVVFFNLLWFACLQVGGNSLRESPSATTPLLIVEYPHDARRPIECLTIHIHNRCDKPLRILDHGHAYAAQQLDVIVRDGKGKPIKRSEPLVAGPREKPTESDYIRIAPGKMGALRIELAPIEQSYAMKPSELYFLDFRFTFTESGVAASTVIPYGIRPR